MRGGKSGNVIDEETYGERRESVGVPIEGVDEVEKKVYSGKLFRMGPVEWILSFEES